MLQKCSTNLYLIKIAQEIDLRMMLLSISFNFLVDEFL